ncbi:MAG: excinuclease ABC subunit UvrC [Candidatus Cloacimonetes bacterium]|nr:excinuclease ABC subunit UvrC [Candidatus Cloacimonadota bacterium]
MSYKVNLSQQLIKTLESIPNESGVYQYFDASNTIIYVGKSKCLKKRVRSYFDRTHDSMRTAQLVQHIVRIEYTTTQNELEALILECNLIKKYQPKYNVLFKDGKTYPYIKFNNHLKYPYIEKVRQVKQDGAKYYGPYVDTYKLSQILKYIDQYYPLVKCNKDVSNRDGKACLDYQINRCVGPCFKEIDDLQYNEWVSQIKDLFEGKVSLVSQRLKVEMQLQAKSLNFEKAAVLRNQMMALDIFTNKQDVITQVDKNEDIIAISIIDQHYLIQHLLVRKGKIIDQRKIMQENTFRQSRSDLLIQYFRQFYLSFVDCAIEVVCEEPIEENDQFNEFCESYELMHNKKFTISIPKIGRRRRLLNLAIKNSSEALRAELYKSDKTGKLLVETKESLNLKSIPYRIECFDISNIQGTDPVASMVVAINGKMDNSEYRRFKIRVKQTPDDFAMMREAVFRRYKRLQDDHKKMPDLIIIDGGLGQLHAAAESLRDLGLSIELTSLAKREELIYVDGDFNSPYQLGRFSQVRLFFQRIRDEAHRFAITYHKKLRSKRTIHSILDEVHGIGKSRREKLLNAFKSVDVIADQTVQNLVDIGIPSNVASDLLSYLKSHLDSKNL